MQEKIYLEDDNFNLNREGNDFQEKIIEINQDEIIPIVISNQRTPEMILGKRFNEDKYEVEYMVKFIELPIENTQWMTPDQINNKRIINNYERKQAKCEQLQTPQYKRFHHIGQNSLQKFLNQAQYIKNWELQDYDTKKKKKPKPYETIDLSDDDEIIEIKQLIIKEIYSFSSFIKDPKKVKFSEYFDLQEHQDEIKDTRFLYDMHIDETKTLTLTRTHSDEQVLNYFGQYLPEIERRPVYYKMLHHDKMYHVFNAQKIYYYDLCKRIAYLISGKHKPTRNFSSREKGDRVIVMNVENLFLYKRDMYRNFYYHIGIPGNLKVKNYKDLYNHTPERLLIYGVWKTLKSNRNRKNYMKKLEVHKGLDVPYPFLPNFNQSPNAEKQSIYEEQVLKKLQLIDYQYEDTKDFPEFVKNMEYKPELKQEIEQQKFNYKIPNKIMKKVNQYNRWVDDYKEKQEKYEAKKPIKGKRQPFSNDKPIYISRNIEKDVEKYPILQEMMDQGEKGGDMTSKSNYGTGYNYGAEKHYGIKYDDKNSRNFANEYSEKKNKKQ